MKKSELLFWKTIVTGFGSGYTPSMPGTAGSLVALVPAVIIFRTALYPNLWLLGLILVFTILGVAGAQKVSSRWGNDPSRVVVDEMAGMWISLLWTGGSWPVIAAAFVLFRFFDILKPLGIRKAERLSGGYGVMADDILAGIYTNLVIQVLLLFLTGIS